METRAIKYKRFHSMLAGMGMKDAKDGLLAAYGVESTTQLSDEELDDLVKRVAAMGAKRYQATPEERKWRSRVLTLLNGYGVYADNGDWSRVNTLLLDKRVCGKLLYEMSIPEMDTLCRKLRSMIEKRNARKEREAYLAQCN